MTDLSDQISTIQSPAEAVGQLLGEQFIEWLAEYVRHHVLSWPAVKKLQTMVLAPDKLKKILLQRLLALKAFSGQSEGDPGFLGFAIANLSESDDPQAESALEILENPELGEKIFVSAKSWENFFEALAISPSDIEHTKPKEGIRNYVAELSDVFSNSEWQSAVGAMASYEWTVMQELNLFARLIKITPNNPVARVLDEKRAIDVGHILDKAVLDLESKRLVWDGVERQMQITAELWDFLLSLI